MYRCFSDIIVKGLSGLKTIYRKNNSASARRFMEMSLNVVVSYKMRGVPGLQKNEILNVKTGSCTGGLGKSRTDRPCAAISVKNCF
jgi:hypothetical protein